jgi:hypothetical protein
VHALIQTSGGGDGYWSVYFTTTDTDIDYSGGSGSSGAAVSSASSSSAAAAAKSSSASSSSAAAAAASTTSTATSASSASDKATVITSIAPGKTVIITQAAASQPTSTSEPTETSKKGGSNTAGIAAGVVVGIVVIAALIGAAVFFLRRKQRREAESHQQLNDYSPSSQKPMTFRPTSGPDSRIDPDAMASRRMSDGSIADNEDYSRRILKVHWSAAIYITPELKTNMSSGHQRLTIRWALDSAASTTLNDFTNIDHSFSSRFPFHPSSLPLYLFSGIGTCQGVQSSLERFYFLILNDEEHFTVPSSCVRNGKSVFFSALCSARDNPIFPCVSFIFLFLYYYSFSLLFI